ncbi:hypothetical protein [Inhella gelatinilytica]|uniref:Tail specific protease domain-containing protein n=1 Tax=Inhella gelatinilytica TaxID=2795030 RepID=A0A931NCS4_9BURK|nr:hypothetical protein [Inhella gelatinilytica]MBH9551540.1 hypothetical protein [Inhella gelatinilytica]
MRTLSLLAAAWLLAVPALAAPSRLADQLGRADAAFAQSDWAQYRAVYAELAAAHPDNGLYAYRLGRAERSLGNRAAARAAFERAVQLGTQQARAELHLAALAAEAGDGAAAVRWFEAARAHHLVNAEQALLGEPALAALAQQPAWRERLLPRLAEGADRPARWAADLDFLARRLPETHWRLEAQLPRERLQAGLRALKADVAKLADWQVHLRLQTLVREAGSGHTSLVPPMQGAGAFHRLPLQFAAFADGWHVQATAPEHARWLGARLLKVGEATPEQALARLTPLLQHDSETGLLRVGQRLMALTEYLAFVGLSEARDQATLLLQRPGAAPERVTLRGQALDMPALQQLVMALEAPAGWLAARQGDAPLHLSEPEQPFLLQALDGGRVYAQLRRVSDGPSETLAAFAQRLQQALQGASGLVLDLRHNSGGNGELLEPLLQALIRSPQLSERGRLHVLTSGRTFSAAALLLGDLERQFPGLIVVGEASGAGPHHVGEDNLILLPNTGTLVLAASRVFVRSFSDDRRRSVAPHLQVAERWADYLQGRDVLLEAARADGQ